LDFYSRRIRRIFPALLLVLICVYVFGWFSLLADEYKQLGIGIAGGSGFVSNFVLWAESGYFDSVAETKPLLHLWSLGIEEQFYIAWPVVLVFAWKKRFNLVTIAVLLAVISFAINLNNVVAEATATFYSPVTRIWELLGGAILAHLMIYPSELKSDIAKKVDCWLGPVVYSRRPEQNGTTLQNTMAFAGISLIVFAVIFFTKAAAFPGWRAAIPVVGAVLIIAAGPQAWLNRVILSQKIIVWAGLISYPLYLWHWPLLSFARILEGKEPSLAIRVAAVFLSFVLAYLTYLLVERPLRFGKYGSVKTIGLTVLMIIVGFVGYNTYRRNGMEFRVSEYGKISKASNEWYYPGDMTNFQFMTRYVNEKNFGAKESTLFIGDSNVEQYYPRIRALGDLHPNGMKNSIFYTIGGCSSTPGITVDSTCNEMPEIAFKLAKSRDDITSVVIGSAWYNYYLDARQTFTDSDGRRYPIAPGTEGYRLAMNSFDAYLKHLKSLNKKIYVILNIPFDPVADPHNMVNRSLRNFPQLLTPNIIPLYVQRQRARYGHIDDDLTRIAKENNVIVIDPKPYLCDAVICRTTSDVGDPIFKDGNHLRPVFVAASSKYIDETVLK